MKLLLIQVFLIFNFQIILFAHENHSHDIFSTPKIEKNKSYKNTLKNSTKEDTHNKYIKKRRKSWNDILKIK